MPLNPTLSLTGTVANMLVMPAAQPVAINRDGYIEDNLDGLFTTLVSPEYARHRGEYMERLRLIYAEDSGRLLFDRLTALGDRHRVYPVLDFVLPPDTDAGSAEAAPASPPRPASPAVRLDNGRCLWDPLCLPLDPRSTDYPTQYRKVEDGLIELCHQLMAINSQHVFASDAARTAPPPPAGSGSTIPVDPVSASNGRRQALNAARPYHLPVWKGETTSVRLRDDLSIRVSKELGLRQDEVLNVLREIGRHMAGRLVLDDLAVCARKGGTLIVAEGKGKSGLTTTRKGEVVWLFDEGDLSRRCIQRGLSESGKPLYSAFVDLIAARDTLGKKLGLDSYWIARNWLSRRVASEEFCHSIQGSHAIEGQSSPEHPQDPVHAIAAPPSRIASRSDAASTAAVGPRATQALAEDAASQAAQPRQRLGRGIVQGMASMWRSVQTRLGVGNASRQPMDGSRPYDALVAFVPDYSVPNEYTPASRR